MNWINSRFFFAANKRVIYTIPSQQQLILWILGCISPFWWHKCVQSSPITDTIYIVHTSSTRSRPLVFYKYFTYKVVTITKVMLLGFYILINVVSQNALKTSMCLCSHYSSKWQKKMFKTLILPRWEIFHTYLSKKEFFHFFLRFSIFIIVIIIEDKNGLKIESRKILRFSKCQPRIIGIYFYTNLSTIFLQEQ